MFYGKFCWFELIIFKGVLVWIGDFYVKLFGWCIVDVGMDGFIYYFVSYGGDMIVGFYEVMDDMFVFWVVYFDVDDVDVVVDKIVILGGKLLYGFVDIFGIGRFVVVLDLQGVVFSIL